MFPQANVSIKDLDQAVALCADATVLGFTIRSTMRERVERSLGNALARQVDALAMELAERRTL